MKKVSLIALMMVIVLTLTGCGVLTRPILNALYDKVQQGVMFVSDEEAAQSETIEFTSEVSGIVVSLSSDDWQQFSDKYLSKLKTSNSKANFNILNYEGTEKTEQVSEVEFCVQKEGGIPSIMITEETYTPSDSYGYQDIQNYMLPRMKAKIGNGVYAIVYDGMGKVKLQGEEYLCYQAREDNRSIYQLYLMREVAEGKGTVVILTADSIENVDALLKLLDENAEPMRVNPDAKAEQIEYVRGEWKKGGQVHGRPLGPIYESEFAQLRFQVLPEWYCATDEDIEELNRTVNSVDMLPEDETAQVTTFIETYALDEVTNKSIIVEFSDVGDEAAIYPAYSFAQMYEQSMVESDVSDAQYESLGISVETLSGQEYACVNVRDIVTGVLEKHFVRTHGNWLIYVHIEAETEANMNAILKWFTEM